MDTAINRKDTMAYYTDLRRAFVEKHVTALLRAIENNIVSVIYAAELTADGCYIENEVVTVNFRGGGKKCINITADSYLYAVKDILNALG